MIELLPNLPDWTAVVAGRTTREHEAFQRGLADRINAAGLQDRIVFVGEVDDIKPWYRKFDLFVAPSRNEGFGLTPLEAMACGTAVVTSDAGAYAELVGEGAGMVVPAGAQEPLTRAIATYLSDPQKCERAGARARRHVLDHFRLDNEADALMAVYRGLLR